ncbi:hypothetical protein, partial [Pseudalkalibacillus hwajinpoensis]|uniref:hypothetical protein n=1 Tax=Guptibacillus hwajinpoensis TaxID=208199 RepID=UPI00384AACFF
MDHIKSPSQKNLISKGQQVSPKSHRNLYILRKAERARLNPQDVGGHESETLYVSFEWVKQPEDLARAAGHRKAERARLNPQDVGGHESETLYVSFEWVKQPE